MEEMIDSYDRLPLGVYARICDICRDESMDDVQRQLCIVGELAGMTEQEVGDMPIDDFLLLSAKARFLEREPVRSPKPRKRYVVGGFTLVPATDMRKVTTSQYIDFQTFMRREGSSFAEVISCLAVPEGHRYADGYDPAEVQDAIREHMSVTDALSMYAFFFSSLERLMKAILSSSKVTVMAMDLPMEKKREAVKRIGDMQRLLRKNGAGSPMSTLSARRAGAVGTRSGR